MEPFLGFFPVYDPTEYATVPLPVPELPEVIVIQLAEGFAVQLQPLSVTAETFP